MEWSHLWRSLGGNLVCVSIMFGLFALCVLANIIAGVYYRVRHIGQDWNRSQFVSSILRMLAIGVSTAILAVVATVAPVVLSCLGLMDEGFSKLVSISLIVGMYVQGIVKYFKEALETIGNILENRDVVKELKTAPPEDIQPPQSTGPENRDL